MKKSALLVGIFLYACAPEPEGPCPQAAELAPGTASALIDGNAYEATANVTWELYPANLFLTFPQVGAYAITISAQTSQAGVVIDEALSAGVPIEVTLKNRAEDGGDLTVTENATSTNSKDGGEGLLTISSWDETTMGGCFFGTSPGHDVTAGVFLATQFGVQ